MQKNQLKVIEEDGKLRKLERDMETKKKELQLVRKNIEKYDMEIANMQKKEFDIQKDMTTIERDTTTQKSLIKKLEYDSEKFREEVFRRDKSDDV